MAKIPKFQNEQEESEFWDTHGSVDYLDDTTPVNVTFVGPRPRKVHITLRLDQETIDNLKKVATHKGIGYQTLIRMWVVEQLALQRETLDASEFIESPVQPESRGLLEAENETDWLNESLFVFIKQMDTLVEQTVRSFQRIARSTKDNTQKTRQPIPSRNNSLPAGT